MAMTMLPVQTIDGSRTFHVGDINSMIAIVLFCRCNNLLCLFFMNADRRIVCSTLRTLSEMQPTLLKTLADSPFVPPNSLYGPPPAKALYKTASGV